VVDLAAMQVVKFLSLSLQFLVFGGTDLAMDVLDVILIVGTTVLATRKLVAKSWTFPLLTR